MAEVIGPCSTLPGRHHDLPEGTVCDQHPDRPAVARVQGETDSFGAELIDMCQECLDEDRREQAEADHSGVCDWCKNPASRVRPQRDYEEGMSGRVYDVCDACIKRVNDEAEADLEARGYYDYDEPDYDFEDDYDPLDDCRMDMAGQCSLAGTDFCEQVCPQHKALAAHSSEQEGRE